VLDPLCENLQDFPGDPALDGSPTPHHSYLLRLSFGWAGARHPRLAIQFGDLRLATPPSRDRNRRRPGSAMVPPRLSTFRAAAPVSHDSRRERQVSGPSVDAPGVGRARS
jgi:hypothetical protein